MMPAIETTITIGNLIEVASMLGLGAVFVIRKSDSLTALQSSVSDMKNELIRLGEAFTGFKVHEARILNIEEDIRELRHGDGFIRHGHRPIDREYGAGK